MKTIPGVEMETDLLLIKEIRKSLGLPKIIIIYKTFHFRYCGTNAPKNVVVRGKFAKV